MCPSLDVTCLVNHTQLNKADPYPMFLGYLSATDILKIADVPSFSRTASNISIIEDIPPFQKPVKRWQRPLDDDDKDVISPKSKVSKVTSIGRVYSDSTHDNLMPNPVILSRNPLQSSTIDCTAEEIEFLVKVPGHSKKALVDELSTIHFEYTGGENPKKPLWILDGQHRVYGMAATSNFTSEGGIDRSDLRIPFILLLGEIYEADQLAEIFTYVTSGATEMDPLHKDWMHYSFDMPKYDLEHNHKAMEAVAYLGKTVIYGGDK